MTSIELKAARFGMIGIGGFGANISKRLIREEGAELIAAYDPGAAGLPEQTARLRHAGVELAPSLDTLLEMDLDAVWLPLPIHLHRSMTETTLHAGKAVVCEKPAAGCVDDVVGMIEARDRAELPVAIGYQDIYRSEFTALKRELLAGRYGAIRRAAVQGSWPRPGSYYGRNQWAGALQRDGVWVLDSPANNAMSHFIHVLLWFMGPTLWTSAQPESIEAELYRANPIENFDTITARLATSGVSDSELMIALTHAGAERRGPVLNLETDRATIEITWPHELAIHEPDAQDDARTRRTSLKNFEPEMIRRLTSFLLGRGGGLNDQPEPASEPVATLEMALAHAQAISAAAEAAPIVPVPEEAIHETDEGVRAVEGLSDAMAEAGAERKLLSELGRYPWAKAGGSREIGPSYLHFAGPREDSK